ncbi:MAG: IstB-like binding protein [Verrucomicrobiota bacterium]|jgi:hypothetical protein
MSMSAETITTATTEPEKFDQLLKELKDRFEEQYSHCACTWYEFECKTAQNALRQKVSTGAMTPTEAIAELSATLEPIYQREEKVLAARRQKRAKHDQSYIITRIPEEYRQPIMRSRLPNPRAFDEVQGWFKREWDTTNYIGAGERGPGDRGIIAVGATGKAKTRALAHFLLTGFTKYWSASDDHSCLFLPATQLKRDATIAAGRPGVEKSARKEAEELVESARTCDVLLLDDLSQPKFTPAYAEYLYEIIEHRTSHRLLILVSLQLGRDEFLEKVSDRNPHLLTTAEAIFRRLTDYCDVIDFDDDTEGTYDHAKWLAAWFERED